MTQRSTGRGFWAALASAFLLIGGCGPTDQKIAVSLLTAIALAVPIAAAINAGLHRLWRDARDVLGPSILEAAVACALAGILAVGVNTAVLKAKDDLVFIGLAFAGGSYLVLYCGALSIGLWRKARWVFRGLFWAPALLFAALLAPIVFKVSAASYNGLVFGVLTWMGGLGVGGGLFLVVLLIVSFVAARRARAADGG